MSAVALRHGLAVNLATADPVEDLKLGLDLAKSGHAPLFCPSARIDSHYPLSPEGAKTSKVTFI